MTLFVAVALLYLSLSPGTVAGMGYIGEEMQAGNQILATLTGSMPGQAIEWPRHGPLSALLDLPFLAIGKVLEQRSLFTQKQVLSLEPVLLTSLLVLILFLWLCDITDSLLWSYALAVIAAFCTLLWPYAYIGLETKQSLLILAAGYIALQSSGPSTWPKALGLGLCCAGAISVKASGTFLIPAAGLLVLLYCARRRHDGVSGWRWHLLLMVLLMAGVYWANAEGRSWYWQTRGGTSRFFSRWLVDGPLEFVLNLGAMLGSPNKGLLLYAPVCLLAFIALPRAWERDRAVVAFAMVTLGGLAGGFALLRVWGDETWGPRYLHAAIGPLILCVGGARRAFGLGHKFVLAAAALVGLGVSFLGAFFYYGSLHGVAVATSQSALETIQGDPVWNHIRFNARLLDVWRSSGPRPMVWTPAHTWWFRAPPDAPPWKSVDLRPIAQPHSFLVRHWGQPKRGAFLILWTGFALCLVLGSALLASVGGLLLWNAPKEAEASPGVLRS